MISKKIGWIVALVCAQIALGVNRPHAEEALRASLSVTNQLESTSKSGPSAATDAGAKLTSALSFGLRSETSTQSLDFGLNTGLIYRFSGTDARRVEFDNPTTARLSYRTESRQSLLSLDANYQRTEVDAANFTEDTTADEDITVGTGTRESLRTGVGLSFGREKPFGGALTYSNTQTRYSNTSDPGLIDADSQNLSVRLNFRLNPVVNADLSAAYRETNQKAVGANDQTSQSLGVGLTYALSPVFDMTARLSHEEVTSTGSSNSGGSLGYSLGLRRTLPNGTLDLEVSSTETINGARQQIVVSRALELSRGKLSFSFGATKTEGTKLQPLTNVGLDYTLSQRSQFTLLLSQAGGVSSTDAETLRTRFRMNLNHDVNDRSSISAGVQLAKQDDLSDGGTDQSTLSANLTYRRDVGGDWDFVTGYRFTSSHRDDQADRKTGTVFVGLKKSFDFLP